MRVNVLRESLRKHPFAPFRLHLTNGLTYDVRHPEMALLTQLCIHLVELTKSGKSINRVVQCDLIHVVAIEPADGSNGCRTKTRRKREG